MIRAWHRIRSTTPDRRAARFGCVGREAGCGSGPRIGDHNVGVLRSARCRRACILAVPLLVLFLGLVSAGAAGASSLVFIKDNNVWLANPDGSGQYQVTTDGTSSDPYMSATQASDGTILAQLGKYSFARLSRTGKRLAPLFGVPPLGFGPHGPVISPDGSKFAYYAETPEPAPGPARVTSQIEFSSADRTTPTELFNPGGALQEYSNPAWLSNSRVVIFNSPDVWTFDLGAADATDWFGWNDVFPSANACGVSGSFSQGALSPDGTTLALVSNPGGYSSSGPGCDQFGKFWGNNALIIFLRTGGDAATGNPPAKPTPELQCVFEAPDGTDGFQGGGKFGDTPAVGSTPLFDSLSWAPDGSAIAYEYNGDSYVATIGSPNDCSSFSWREVIAGGTHPFWGPADVPASNPNNNNNQNNQNNQNNGGPQRHTTPGTQCAGLSVVQILRCGARRIYNQALAACQHKYHGHGRQATACRRRATTAYHRNLALINCTQIANRRRRAACVKAARRVK